MKNLANCTPTEFLRQTFRIKQLAEKWVKEIDILSIRKNIPQLKEVKNLSGEAKEQAQKENREIVKNQILDNFMSVLDKILDQHAEDTVAILALVCFVEPEDADRHTMSEYLESLGEMLSDKGVVSFFTSLAQLDQKNM